MADEYKPIKLTSKDLVKLKVRRRRRIPLNDIIRLLTEGYDVFIPEMNRKTASYLKKKLSEILKTDIISFPSEFQGMNGYTFKIALIDKILTQFGEEDNNSNKS